MLRITIFGLFLSIVACGSDSSPRESNRIFAVNGAQIPDAAELAVWWGRGPDGNEYVEGYLLSGGRLEGEVISIGGPSPLEAVSERYGIAAGVLLAYPSGQAPSFRSYTDSDEDTAMLREPIGFANRHSLIYKTHDSVRPEWLPDDFVFWGDQFPLGLSCALNIKGAEFDENGERVDEFDSFEPVDCSELELRFGNSGDIRRVGGDWT